MVNSTYQIVLHLYRFFENRPDHGFIAWRGGERAIVAEVWLTVHAAKQIVNGNLVCDFNFRIYFKQKYIFSNKYVPLLWILDFIFA